MAALRRHQRQRARQQSPRRGADLGRGRRDADHRPRFRRPVVQPVRGLFPQRWGPTQRTRPKTSTGGSSSTTSSPTSAAVSTSSTAATRCSGSTTPSTGASASRSTPRGYYAAGPQPLTATATLNQPFALEVGTWEGYNEGARRPRRPHQHVPSQGAEVAPVVTNDQRLPESRRRKPATTVVTGGDGKASITFTAPGWHRIKATSRATAPKARSAPTASTSACRGGGDECGPTAADEHARTAAADRSRAKSTDRRGSRRGEDREADPPAAAGRRRRREQRAVRRPRRTRPLLRREGPRPSGR